MSQAQRMPKTAKTLDPSEVARSLSRGLVSAPIVAFTIV